MTGVTLELTNEQFEELRRYEDNRPHNVGHRPNSNLIRRGMLTLSPRKQGFYEITQLGQHALRDFREEHAIKGP